jgi:hypothetical protein
MWISFPPDLHHWGSKLMLEARRGSWWDANKIGLSPRPSKRRVAGWSFITACQTMADRLSIRTGSVCFGSVGTASNRAMNEFSARKKSTSNRATSTTSFSLQLRLQRTATPFTSITRGGYQHRDGDRSSAHSRWLERESSPVVAINN